MTYKDNIMKSIRGWFPEEPKMPKNLLKNVIGNDEKMKRNIVNRFFLGLIIFIIGCFTFNYRFEITANFSYGYVGNSIIFWCISILPPIIGIIILFLAYRQFVKETKILWIKKPNEKE